MSQTPIHFSPATTTTCSPSMGRSTHTASPIGELSDPNSPNEPSTRATTGSDEEHVEITQHALNAMGDYLHSDLKGVLLDYNLLTRMNEAMDNRYAEMTGTTNTIVRQLTEVNTRYGALEGPLSKIQKFGTAIDQLEEAAFSVSQYIGQLEALAQTMENK